LTAVGGARRLDDGREWSGQDLEDVTGGVVSRSYVSNLKKGRIENPGLVKLEAIAAAMGFPPTLWFASEEERVVDDALPAALRTRRFELHPWKPRSSGAGTS
jgi:transcriptional regulator with XRE-family HTH domain